MAIKIDTTKPFRAILDLSAYVKKVGADFGCTKCDKVLVKIEPDGILGVGLNSLDTTVILDHHLAQHNQDPMRPVTLNPDTVWGP